MKDDKEAQEKIAKCYLAEGNWDKLSLATRDGYLARAGSIIETLKELGYRKPLDRPEWRRKINLILERYSFDQGGWNVLPTAQFGEVIDQILALILDKSTSEKMIRASSGILHPESDFELPKDRPELREKIEDILIEVATTPLAKKPNGIQDELDQILALITPLDRPELKEKIKWDYVHKATCGYISADEATDGILALLKGGEQCLS